MHMLIVHHPPVFKVLRIYMYMYVHDQLFLYTLSYMYLCGSHSLFLVLSPDYHALRVKIVGRRFVVFDICHHLCSSLNLILQLKPGIH